MFYGNTKKRRTARVMAIIALLYTVLIAVSSCNTSYSLSKDIESVAHRAQVAASADDMLLYMIELKANMESHGITQGHSTPIFQSPANDLALLFDSINRIIERLEEVKDLPKSETAYQVALDDLRGTIRELEAPSFGVTLTQYWMLWLICILLWVWPVIYLFFYS